MAAIEMEKQSTIGTTSISNVEGISDGHTNHDTLYANNNDDIDDDSDDDDTIITPNHITIGLERNNTNIKDDEFVIDDSPRHNPFGNTKGHFNIEPHHRKQCTNMANEGVLENVTKM